MVTPPPAPEAEGDPNEEETFLDKLRASLVDSAGLDDIPEPEPLVEDVIYRDSLTWIQGKRGNGKSFVAIDLGGCVATGEMWQGHPVKQGKVLYLAAEGVSGMRLRVRAWEKAMARSMDNVQWLPMPVQASLDQWYYLIELAIEIQPTLIVLDTQARITVGMEENAAKDMGEFVEKLELLRRATGACVLVVHHMGHNGEHMRGSTALEGAATTIVKVAKDEDQITVSCTKQKDAKEFDEINLRLIEMEHSAVLMQSTGFGGSNTAALKMASKWWEIHGDTRVSISKLEKSDVASERTIYRHLGALKRLALVEPVEFGGHTFYVLTRDPSI